ncbi:MAG: DCC1-like thiol-disulfide oxidoreductase family protein [Flavobacteriaceae bacterium]|nr:DCC1-like thiol-disulfide oxidoreductase family protein [Flavobacteriaceae bacterium]
MFENIDNIPENKKLILFDGVCNLCNEAVLKIIKQDKKDIFLFTALQSNTGKNVINELGIDTSKIDSIVLYIPGEDYFIKSEAAFKIANEFYGIWKLIQVFRIFPVFFNDFFYDFIARNRYRWFGKKEECMIPTEKLNSKFLN